MFCVRLLFVFFFKQKTAYEMRISDWSSDVCSSDLPEDEHSRYIEADVKGLRVASIYLPNGNPQPGPKFDYKLRWMKRLRDRATAILAEEIPAVLAGDYNVIPHDRDVFSTRPMPNDSLTQPESPAAYPPPLGPGGP